MSQQIKCPHCHKSFTLEEGFKDDLEIIKKKETAKVQNKIRLEEEKNAGKKYQAQLNEANRKLAENEKKEKKLKLEIQEQADKNADKKYKSELKDTQSELDKAKKNLLAKDKESEINNKRLLKRLEQQERLIKEKEKLLKQKSTEVQGEVQEELLEDFLKRKFPDDKVTPIEKGKKGGDCILTILDNNKKKIGEIYFERKDREKVFQEKWVNKLLNDMKERDIGYGILVSASLPKDFNKDDDAFVTRHNNILVVPMSNQLVHALVYSFRNELVEKSKKNKDFDAPAEMQKLWNLVTGDQFSLRIRTLALKIFDFEKSIKSRKKFHEKNIADDENILINMKDELKNFLLSFRSQVGLKFEDNLLEPPKDK